MTRDLKSLKVVRRRMKSPNHCHVALILPTRSGEADNSANTMDAAAVTINIPAGMKNSGDDEKMNAPETIKADTIKPFSEIMMLALVAASASSSISVRKALRNMVSTPLAVPNGLKSDCSFSVFVFWLLFFLFLLLFLGFILLFSAVWVSESETLFEFERSDWCSSVCPSGRFVNVISGSSKEALGSEALGVFC